jgi:cytoskeletal protein RodZ
MNQQDDPEQAPDGLEVIREYDDEVSSTTNHDASSVTAAPSLIKSRKDENLVMCSRVAVVAVLLLSALIVALLVYNIVSHDEEHEFKAKVSQSYFISSVTATGDTADSVARQVFMAISGETYKMLHVRPNTWKS